MILGWASPFNPQNKSMNSSRGFTNTIIKYYFSVYVYAIAKVSK